LRSTLSYGLLTHAAASRVRPLTGQRTLQKSIAECTWLPRFTNRSLCFPHSRLRHEPFTFARLAPTLA